MHCLTQQTCTPLDTSFDEDGVRIDNQSRLNSLGTMTAQLAHQIRTPLSSAILYAEHLSNLPNLDTRTHTWIKRLQECHKDIELHIHNILLFAKGTLIEPKLNNMELWGSQLLQRAQPYIESYSAIIQLQNLLHDNECLIHAESLIGAVLNLIINALQAEATEIYISLASLDDSGIQISIRDNGKGMSEHVKKNAFVQFFTTKAQGTGLGLAVVLAVIKAHRGKVLLESSEGMGTQVTINVPRDTTCII